MSFRTLSQSPDALPGKPRHMFWGLFNCKPRWGLTVRGWLILVLFLILTTGAWILNVQTLLAQTKREDAKIMVVEGWVKGYAFQAAVTEFQSGHYEKVFTTGGPVAGTGRYLNDYNTSASVGAEALVKAGFPANLVQMVPSHVSGRDRTYSSALALREYFHTNGMAVKNFNVLTEDVHARRTRMLFQKAFGADVMVGIISVPDPDYDSAHWWRYSEGVREVLGESIAYLYAALFFHPAPPQK